MFNRSAHIIFIGIPVAITLLFVLVLYLNIDHWIINLLGFFVALGMLYSVVVLLWGIVRKKSYTYWMAALINTMLAAKFMRQTVSFHPSNEDGESDFSVMSYNIATFNPTRTSDKSSDSLLYKSFYDWMRQKNTPDILCLQEFYYSNQTDYDRTLDSIVAIGDYSYYYTNPVYIEDLGGIMGVITFSKFPVLRSGEVKFGGYSINRGTYHDFVIKNDTIRVLNFQLYSMNIRVDKTIDAMPLLKPIYLVIDIVEKLKRGYEKRSEELTVIDSVIAASPYKLIVCADLNAIPYSKSYKRLSKSLNNAYEFGGNGFGFTYRNFPWIIRIDHQFYDKRLRINRLKLHKDFQVSDHYPIESSYQFKKP